MVRVQSVATWRMVMKRRSRSLGSSTDQLYVQVLLSNRPGAVIPTCWGRAPSWLSSPAVRDKCVWVSNAHPRPVRRARGASQVQASLSRRYVGVYRKLGITSRRRLAGTLTAGA
jgi:hypothetical protein